MPNLTTGRDLSRQFILNVASIWDKILMQSHRSASAPVPWQEGMPLSDAWYFFAAAADKLKFKKNPAHRHAMIADLWANLADDVLVAYGDCIEPDISDGPVRIPSHSFNDYIRFNFCDSDEFEMSGWRYSRVRISRSCELPISEVGTVASEPADLSKKRVGGRKNIYDRAREILDDLFTIKANRGLSSAMLHADFEKAFAERYPREDYHIDPPGERSLRTYLKRYRKELEETGK